MNNRILVFGDSITWGAWDKEGGWATRLKKYADNQAIDGYENYDTVYQLGISGDNTDDLLSRFESELASRVDEDSDMVILFAIGTNDSHFDVKTLENRVSEVRYRDNLQAMIKISQKVAKNIVFIGLTPVDDDLLNPMPWKLTHGYNNENVQKYNQYIIEIAKENNISMIDLYDYFTQMNYKNKLSDGLHPNTDGHEMIYAKVLKELKELEILK